MKSIIIVGTGNLAEIAIQYLKRDVENPIIAFSVEKKYNTQNEFCGLPIINFENLLNTHPPTTTKLLIAIGPNKTNTVRERLYNEAKELGYSFLTYISPRANVWDPKMVGENSFIFDGCIVEPEAQIGVNTIMWSGSIVAHHSIVGDHCFLAPSATAFAIALNASTNNLKASVSPLAPNTAASACSLTSPRILLEKVVFRKV